MPDVLPECRMCLRLQGTMSLCNRTQFNFHRASIVSALDFVTSIGGPLSEGPVSFPRRTGMVLVCGLTTLMGKRGENALRTKDSRTR